MNSVFEVENLALSLFDHPNRCQINTMLTFSEFQFVCIAKEAFARGQCSQENGAVWMQRKGLSCIIDIFRNEITTNVHTI